MMALQRIDHFTKCFSCVKFHFRNIVTVERTTVFNLFAAKSGGSPDQSVGSDLRKLSNEKAFVNCQHIHYTKTGVGKKWLLLLPGVLGCAETDFMSQLNGLNKDLFTMVAFDPRGYGRSIPPDRDWPVNFFQRDAQDGADLMKSLGVDKYAVLGWSDGGIAALTLFTSPTVSVNKLVLWGANSYFSDDDMKVNARITDLNEWSERQKKVYLSVYREEYFKKQLSGYREVCQKIAKEHKGQVIGIDLAKVNCPTLIIHGLKDQLCSVDHARNLKQNIKTSRLEIMDDGGHNVHQKYAAKFNSIVEQFLLEPV